jgi:hypothetical protein
MSLSPEEVCRILKVCGETNVLELKFGDLAVVFGASAKNSPEPVISPSTVAEITAVQRVQAEKSLLRDEIAMKEQELAEMAIESPLKYEELLMQGELNESSDTETDQ